MDIIRNVDEADVVVAALASMIIQLRQVAHAGGPAAQTVPPVLLVMTTARQVMERVQEQIRAGTWS